MDSAIRLFKSQGVEVLERGTEEYDRAIATSNLVFRFSVPDCVVRPKTAANVQAVVKGARSTQTCHQRQWPFLWGSLYHL